LVTIKLEIFFNNFGSSPVIPPLYADNYRMRTTIPRCLAALLFLILGTAANAEVFRFKHTEGDYWRINSIVLQTVSVDKEFSHNAEITNRITLHISDVTDNTAEYTGTFMTSERTSNRSFSWGREYESVFRRDQFGNYSIQDRYFMPVVRNVPVFPEQDVQPGESWSAEGEEAHDLRDHFGLEKPFTVPFTAVYTYEGPVELDGKTLHKIIVEYTLFFDTPVTEEMLASPDKNIPVTTMGHSRQTLYWDNDLGMLPNYSEEYRILLKLASGTLLEFKGTAEAVVTETKLMDREKEVREMNEELEKLGIADTTAHESEEGITISMENIQFEPDSARLMPAEKEKITRIAALLERYPDKELLISGHTALAGTPGARQKLSEERAEAVAQFLVEMGVRSEYNVYTRGFGAERPVAPNTTEANRARNRRVEITILEK